MVRSVEALIAAAVVLSGSIQLFASQEPTGSALQMKVVEGAKPSTLPCKGDPQSKQLVVEVTLDGKPVQGAVVSFVVPQQGPSAIFVNESRTMQISTDEYGQAVISALRPNKVPGTFEIAANASYQGQQATLRIPQDNEKQLKCGGNGKTIGLLALVGAGVAAGAAVALGHKGGSSSTSTSTQTTNTTVTISPGSGNFGHP
jgi:hypothetical protein